MKLRKKHTLFLGVALLAAGLLTLLSVFVYIGFDFTKLNGIDLTQKTVSIEEPFDSISIDADWFDVKVLPQSEGSTAQLLAPEGQNLHTECSVKDGTLSVAVKDTRPWYERFFSFTPDELGSVTVYLPADIYHELKITANTGDIRVDSDTPEALFFEETRIQVSTGDIFYHADIPQNTPFVPEHMHGVVLLESSTGDITINDTDAYVIRALTTTGDVTITDSSARILKVNCDTGDVLLRNMRGDVESGALDLAIETSTGDVTLTNGTLASGHITTSTGDVNVDTGITTHELRIHTSTGEVTVKEHSANFISIETSSGDVLCDGTSSRRFSVITSSGDVECPPSAQKGDYCEVKTSSGDVTIINTPN